MNCNEPIDDRERDAFKRGFESGVDSVESNDCRWTDEDMEAFAEWISINATPSLLYGYWILNGTGEEVTTAQLRELWEVWKLAQQRCNGGCCDNGTGYCMFCEKKLI